MSDIENATVPEPAPEPSPESQPAIAIEIEEIK